MKKSELMEKIKEAQKNPGKAPRYHSRGRILLEEAVGCKPRKNQIKQLEKEKLIYRDMTLFDWCIREGARLEGWND